MHERLAALLPLDEIRACCHDDADGCDCRKPKPGFLTRAPHYDVGRSVIVGYRWRDVAAGRRAGCRAAILIDYDYDEHHTVEPDIRVGSLSEASDWILSHVVKP
jgi:D-glycero-D-manno-heptose 1,7-bisphosphate phosphatase